MSKHSNQATTHLQASLLLRSVIHTSGNDIPTGIHVGQLSAVCRASSGQSKLGVSAVQYAQATRLTIIGATGTSASYTRLASSTFHAWNVICKQQQPIPNAMASMWIFGVPGSGFAGPDQSALSQSPDARDSPATPFDSDACVPSGRGVFSSMNNGNRMSTSDPRLCLMFAVNVLSLACSPAMHDVDLREPCMRVRQKLAYVLTPTAASLRVGECLRVGERPICDTQPRPCRERDGQLVRLEMRSNDLSSESHVRFDRDEVFGRAGEGRAGRRLEHVPSILGVERGDGRAVREPTVTAEADSYTYHSLGLYFSSLGSSVTLCSFCRISDCRRLSMAFFSSSLQATTMYSIWLSANSS